MLAALLALLTAWALAIGHPTPPPEPDPVTADPTPPAPQPASPSTHPRPAKPAPSPTPRPSAPRPRTEQLDLSIWDRVAWCESAGRWDAHPSDYRGAYYFFGGLQFTQQAWEGVGGLSWAPRADLATKAEQIAAARRALAIVGPTAWPNCGPRAGLTRTNGHADRHATPQEAP